MISPWHICHDRAAYFFSCSPPPAEAVAGTPVNEGPGPGAGQLTIVFELDCTYGC